MAGKLNHSPADILARLLITKGVVSDPEAVPLQAWPVKTSREPTAPDNVVTLFNTAGIAEGSEMVKGEKIEKHGIQVRIRSQSEPVGYKKAREIATTLDTSVYRDTVTAGGSTYLVQSVRRTSDVITLGDESPNSKRRVYTVNALMTVRQLS